MPRENRTMTTEFKGKFCLHAKVMKCFKVIMHNEMINAFVYTIYRKYSTHEHFLKKIKISKCTLQVSERLIKIIIGK